jgi:PhzF family phenazine biosynthesis protein
VRIYQVDSFTTEAFRGNPAGVCLVESQLDEAFMQSVAAEMNLAETAFVERLGDGFSLRWFTPTTEVDLCGHATLASAHVLWQEGEDSPELAFHTRSGVLVASRSGEQIALDFPALVAEAAETPAGLVEALGATPVWVGRSRFDLLCVLADEAAVRALTPNIATIAALDARGVIVTAPSDGPASGADFVSRFFAPNVGVDEDPVTGSAHCVLAPYWTARTGRNDLVGYQASRRGGYVGVRVDGDRVTLLGSAVTVLAGELAPAPA